jgi:hypothetical protein
VGIVKTAEAAIQQMVNVYVLYQQVIGVRRIDAVAGAVSDLYVPNNAIRAAPDSNGVAGILAMVNHEILKRDEGSADGNCIQHGTTAFAPRADDDPLVRRPVGANRKRAVKVLSAPKEEGVSSSQTE